MPTKTISCPHCGLVLTIKRVKGGTRISYDPAEWRRLCNYPALDSPILCLVEKRGANGPATPNRPPGHR
ncbi:MAG TPA: hypothetical protein VG758_27655 [Hyphomicrobiaceae bacterium]|nr:hypothetical protein [Hyphomicrobiaceae bacterium]